MEVSEGEEELLSGEEEEEEFGLVRKRREEGCEV